MSFPMALFVTVLLLVGSGFFVAAEFALVAAKRHRVEKAAADGSAVPGQPSPACASCP